MAPDFKSPIQKQLMEGVFYFRVDAPGKIDHGKIVAVVHSEGSANLEWWDLVSQVGPGGDPNYAPWPSTELGAASGVGHKVESERVASWTPGPPPPPPTNPPPATGTLFERHKVASTIVP